MQNQSNDRAQVVAIPPVFAAGALLAGVLLNWLFPLRKLPFSIALPVGTILVVLSIFLALGGVRSLTQAKTPIDIRKSTTRIVTSGPYRWSRNPLYLMFAFLLAGIGLIVNNLWILAMIPVLVIVLNRAIILPEERYLEKKFGEEYLKYKKSVRRWL